MDLKGSVLLNICDGIVSVDKFCAPLGGPFIPRWEGEDSPYLDSMAMNLDQSTWDAFWTGWSK